jgi:hypothetical protein
MRSRFFTTLALIIMGLAAVTLICYASKPNPVDMAEATTPAESENTAPEEVGAKEEASEKPRPKNKKPRRRLRLFPRIRRD